MAERTEGWASIMWCVRGVVERKRRSIIPRPRPMFRIREVLGVGDGRRRDTVRRIISVSQLFGISMLSGQIWQGLKGKRRTPS